MPPLVNFGNSFLKPGATVGMYISILLLLILFIAYFFLIRTYEKLWDKIPFFSGAEPTTNIRITVIIPARNEEQNIEACLRSVLRQNYSKELLEIIVVDDHSEDKTADLVKQFEKEGVRLISLKEHIIQGTKIGSYKKKAIEVAIAQAKGAIIVTTDADCTAGKNWIGTIVGFYEKKQSALIVAPVRLEGGRSLLAVFQSLDFVILQGITAASVYGKLHNMCNGANLAYEKAAFNAVNGFEGIDHLASGDDMLLMEKIASKFPDRIDYLNAPEAIVTSKPAKTIKEFFNQRIRWASKTTSYKSMRIKLVLLLVLLVNLSFITLLVASAFSMLWFRFFWVVLFYKVLIEWRFVKSVLRFYSLQRLLPLFPLLQLLHALYTVFAGFAGLFTRYEWKGRKVI